MQAFPILILKTGALGDVLRTTSILPGLRQRYAGAQLTWLTADGAVDLVRLHPQVERTLGVALKTSGALARVGDELARTEWRRVISLDDEDELCDLATRLAAPWERAGVLSGAYRARDGRRAYTPDVGPWFDMGLLSVHGKARADELKIANRESHPALYARMLAIEHGAPRLELTPEARAFGRAFVERHGLKRGRRLVGLNTGSGGRWESKKLSVERTIETARGLHAARQRAVEFVLLGGPDEAARNAAIRAGLPPDLRCVDAGTDNPLLEFGALVGELDLLLTSDSLALHVALARRTRCVAFFAPTSAAEIEFYGLGEAVASTAPDYCSYRPDADNASITPQRLVDACLRWLDPLGTSGPLGATT
jgi:heptosyltransferase-2